MHYANLCLPSYAALGLVHTLNPSASGGVEPLEAGSRPADSVPAAAETVDSTTTTVGAIPKGHGRIVRDAEGNVVGVELAAGEDEDAENADADQDREMDMEELAPAVDGAVLGKWVTELGGGLRGSANVVDGELRLLFSFLGYIFWRHFLVRCASGN